MKAQVDLDMGAVLRVVDVPLRLPLDRIESKNSIATVTAVFFPHDSTHVLSRYPIAAQDLGYIDPVKTKEGAPAVTTYCHRDGTARTLSVGPSGDSTLSLYIAVRVSGWSEDIDVCRRAKAGQ
jgi:hypothetical protein